METAYHPDSFEKRYYEHLKRQTAAPELGRVALGSLQPERLESLEKRRYDELTSGLAEALPGRVRTEWAFTPEHGKLVAEDGQALEQLLINGFRHSLRLAARDEFYESFLPARARHELDELREQEGIINGRVPFNTILTFSPYSQEYDTPETRLKLKKAAQEPDWQRGMIRVSHWDGRQLHVFTRSVDNSSVSLLRETAKRQLGYEFEAEDSTAMLGERLHLEIDDESWRDLADSLATRADEILAERLGGKWLQGRQVEEAVDAQQYVESKTQIIQSLLDQAKLLAERYEDFDSYKRAFDKEIYNHIALLKLYGELNSTEGIVDIAVASSAAGALAEARGDIYNMCGYVLKPDGAIAQAAENTGFESLRRLVGKEVACPACREQVVMPAIKLVEGKLCCPQCQYEVDACTGYVYRHPKITKQPPRKTVSRPKPPKETDWQRINRQSRQANEERRLGRIESQKKKRQMHRLAEIERQKRLWETV